MRLWIRRSLGLCGVISFTSIIAYMLFLAGIPIYVLKFVGQLIVVCVGLVASIAFGVHGLLEKKEDVK